MDVEVVLLYNINIEFCLNGWRYMREKEFIFMFMKILIMVEKFLVDFKIFKWRRF